VSKKGTTNRDETDPPDLHAFVGFVRAHGDLVMLVWAVVGNREVIVVAVKIVLVHWLKISWSNPTAFLPGRRDNLPGRLRVSRPLTVNS